MPALWAIKTLTAAATDGLPSKIQRVEQSAKKREQITIDKQRLQEII